MEKLQKLHAHLLAEVPGLQARPDAVHVYAEQGTTISYAGDANQNFKLAYTASILFEKTTLNIGQLSYILLRFLAEHQPVQANNEPLRWQAEILSKSHTDVMVSLDLTETVIVVNVAEQIELTRSREVPDQGPEIDNLGLTIEYQPLGPPQAKS